MSDEGRQEQLWKLFIFILGLLASGAISLASWTALQVISLGRDISAISSSRCTAQDCFTIRESISDLRAQISVIPKEVPPKWFLDKVNALDLRQSQESNELERRVSALERGVWIKEEQGKKLR